MVNLWAVNCSAHFSRKIFLVYEKIVLSHLTFIVDLTMNLMRKLYHECERSEHYSPSKST